MDAILSEIEQFQEETDALVNNMQNIDRLINQGEASNEELIKGLTKE